MRKCIKLQISPSQLPSAVVEKMAPTCPALSPGGARAFGSYVKKLKAISNAAARPVSHKIKNKSEQHVNFYFNHFTSETEWAPSKVSGTWHKCSFYI